MTDDQERCLGQFRQAYEAAGAVPEGLLDQAPGEPGQAAIPTVEALADAGPGEVSPASA